MNTSWTRRDLLKVMASAGALSSTSLLTACGGGSGGESIASSLTTTTADDQAATYRNVDRLYATRTIERGASTLALPTLPNTLDGLRYTYGEASYSVSDFMSRTRSSGLIILKGGNIALEKYAMGNDSNSRWTSFSVAKSLTSTLVGAALKDGAIASLDDGVSKYVSDLKGTAYEQNSIRQLLRMTSGVNWNEDYSNPNSDIAQFAQAWGSNQSGAVMKVIKKATRAAAPGSVFNYSTGESYVLGAIVAAATGQKLSTYLSQKIWAPFGMQSNGYWALDATDGLEMGGNNFSATLRDYARIGQFVLKNGVVNGQRVLPDGWRDLVGQPDNALTANGNVYPDYPLGYGYQWWTFPTGVNAVSPYHDAAFTAEGIYGQFIYLNPKEDVVAVVWSAWPEPWVTSNEYEVYTLLGTAVAYLQQ